MATVKAKSAKNLMIKAWRLCTTLPNQTSSRKGCTTPSSRSCRASNGKRKKAGKVTPVPVGYFSVYVGPEKQRFVVKTEFANHPLFKVLLDDAALEYGYRNDGPLLLPCDVDLFYNVLAEMESVDIIDEELLISSNWSLIQNLFSPIRGYSRMRESYCDGGYRLLSSSPMLRMNTC